MNMKEAVMKEERYQIAQVNIARMVAPIESPEMADFVGLLDEINELADKSPGFVWRLQTEEGDATGYRPYEDDKILVNLSVWETIEDLKNYVYKSAHGKVMQRRREWFEKFKGMYMVMWWVKAGHIPSVKEAKEKLEYLSEHGESELAFTFKQEFEAPNVVGEKVIGSEFESCPAS